MPIVVLAEIMHISKKKRIKMSFTETVRRIEDSENFKIAPLDLDILNVADNIEHDFVQKGVRQVKYFHRLYKKGQASKILPEFKTHKTFVIQFAHFSVDKRLKNNYY